jgi:hypothetical protein
MFSIICRWFWGGEDRGHLEFNITEGVIHGEVVGETAHFTRASTHTLHGTRKFLADILERISALEKQATNAIRDVRRFTCPLRAAWNKISPFRKTPRFQHWGVLVANVNDDLVKDVVCCRKPLKKETGYGLGVIHELSRVGKQSAYRVYEWMSNAIKKGYRFTRI